MDNKEKKSPLNWQIIETLEHGDVRAEITTATTQNGKRLYSTGFRRIVRDRDGVDVGKTTGFFKGPQDFESIKHLCDEVKYWIDADQEEQHTTSNKHNHRQSRRA